MPILLDGSYSGGFIEYNYACGMVVLGGILGYMVCTIFKSIEI